MQPLPNPWSMSYTTCRGSPGQRGTAMVRRRDVQGAGASGRWNNQWKAQGMGGIWALLMAEGPFAPLPPSWAVPGLFLRDGAMERMTGKKWAMSELLQSCSDSKDAMSKDQDWKAGWGTPTAHRESEGQSHAHYHPRTTGGGSTGAIQETESFRKPSSLLLNASTFSEILMPRTSRFHQMRRHIFQVLPVEPPHLYFTLWCKGSVFLRDISQRGKSSHSAHERERCHENKGQQSTTCSKNRGNTKAAKIECTSEWRKQ